MSAQAGKSSLLQRRLISKEFLGDVSITAYHAVVEHLFIAVQKFEQHLRLAFLVGKSLHLHHCTVGVHAVREQCRHSVPDIARAALDGECTVAVAQVHYLVQATEDIEYEPRAHVVRLLHVQEQNVEQRVQENLTPPLGEAELIEHQTEGHQIERGIVGESMREVVEARAFYELFAGHSTRTVLSKRVSVTARVRIEGEVSE